MLKERGGLDATGWRRRAGAHRGWDGGGVGSLAGEPGRGWYGLKKGLRGRFRVYVLPLLEALGLAEVENNPRNHRMRAL
jgi:hypothetical protein